MSNIFTTSKSSSIVMARVRKMREKGRKIEFKGVHRHLLHGCLDRTPVNCNDKEWENMIDVGKEIVGE